MAESAELQRKEEEAADLAAIAKLMPGWAPLVKKHLQLGQELSQQETEDSALAEACRVSLASKALSNVMELEPTMHVDGVEPFQAPLSPQTSDDAWRY